MKEKLSRLAAKIGSRHLVGLLAAFPMVLVLCWLAYQWKGQPGGLAVLVDQGGVLQSDLDYMSSRANGSGLLSMTKDQILETDIKDRFGFQTLKEKFINSELTKNGVRGAGEEELEIGKNGVDTVAHSKLSYIMTKKGGLAAGDTVDRAQPQVQADLAMEVAKRKRMGLPPENIEKGLSFREKLAIEKRRVEQEYLSGGGGGARVPVNMTTAGSETEVAGNARPARQERKPKVAFYTEISKVEKPPKAKVQEVVEVEEVEEGGLAPPVQFTYEPMQGVIDQRVKVRPGDKIQVRLLSDYLYKGVELKRNTLLYGLASLSGNRLDITVNSLHHDGGILPCGLKIYDTDGMEGIYINSDYEGLSREAVSEGLKEAGNGLDVKIPLVGFSLKLGKRKNRETAALVPAGYPVLLYDPSLEKQVR